MGAEVVRDNTAIAAKLAREVLTSPEKTADIAIRHVAETAKTSGLNQKQIAALRELLEQAEAQPVEKVSATLGSTMQSYADNRPGISDHPAVDYKVTLLKPENAREVLRTLLGNDADLLVSDWGNRVNFDRVAPLTSAVTLFQDSNNKARNRDYAAPGAKTTQEEDFKAAGLTFGDDLQATIVCAALVKKVKDGGQLNSEEQSLYSKLQEGVVRTSSGALDVRADGRLRALNYRDLSFPDNWAFGGRLPE